MPSTLFYGLPLIAEGQAQKHVTANAQADALSVLAGGAVRSATEASPSSPADGDAYIVPPGGGSFTNAEGVPLPAGAVAVRVGGAWYGGRPPLGTAMWVADEGRSRVLVNRAAGDWRAGSVTGAATEASAGIEIHDDTLDVSGATVTAAGLIPTRCILLGVTSWVVSGVTGATSYDCGDGTTVDRFGGALGVAVGASNVGLIGPVAVYDSPLDVVLTANGGNFTGGTVGVAATVLRAAAPV